MTLPEDQNQLLEQIHHDEQWLRDVDPLIAWDEPRGGGRGADVPNIEAIKLRIRIAANEAWLADQVDDPAAPGFAARIKQAVWTEAAHIKGRTLGTTSERFADRHHLVQVSRWAAGLAAMAATVALGFFLLRNEPRSQSASGNLAEGFSYVEAFTEYEEPADWSQMVVRLEEDLEELETGRYRTEYTDWEEDPFEEISGDIDELLSEPLYDADWS